MAESDMRSRLCRELKSLDAVSVENPAHPGTPDINCIPCWIECKWRAAWPARRATIVQMPHYTRQQRVWHHRRARRGGLVWVLLQVRQEWLLLWGPVAAEHLGDCTREELVELAHGYWPKGLRSEELIECITKRPE